MNSFYEGMVTSHIVHEESAWFFRIQDALNWTALDYIDTLTYRYNGRNAPVFRSMHCIARLSLTSPRPQSPNPPSWSGLQEALRDKIEHEVEEKMKEWLDKHPLTFVNHSFLHFVVPYSRALLASDKKLPSR